MESFAMTSKKNTASWFLGALAALCVPAALLAAENKPAAAPRLSTQEIVDKYVAARGGLQAWHALQSISYNGKMQVGYGNSAARSAQYVSGAALSVKARERKIREQIAEGKPQAAQVQLPFVLEMKRPNKSRVEVEFEGKTAVQVYDGQSGWLMRPYLNRDDWEPFSPDQARMQAAEPGLDGLLLDSASQGTKVDFESVEPVEGHPAYKLKLTLKSGEVRHVWVDTKSFLDVKIEGTPRRMDGRMHNVWVYQRDFRSVQGVTVPFVLETAVDGYPDRHQMVIEKVALNPKLDDAVFAKPKA
jgi:outer membrane lipoprotein-sorting protein